MLVLLPVLEDRAKVKEYSLSWTKMHKNSGNIKKLNLAIYKMNHE